MVDEPEMGNHSGFRISPVWSEDPSKWKAGGCDSDRMSGWKQRLQRREVTPPLAFEDGGGTVRPGGGGGF